MPVGSQQTVAQIIAKSCQIAKVPGQGLGSAPNIALDLLNGILEELAQTYDLEVAKAFAQVTLNAGSNSGFPNTLGLGGGPYLLPTDYLRLCAQEIFYYVSGEPFIMVNISMDEFETLVQQAGISNFPEQFATDTSNYAINLFGAPVLYVWPPSGFSLVANIRYYRLPLAIPAIPPAGTIPWFPNSNYLITRLAGELMKLADDARTDTFLGDGPGGAQGILNRYLKLQGDTESRSQHVTLDRRRFGKSFDRLPQTKTLGW